MRVSDRELVVLSIIVFALGVILWSIMRTKTISRIEKPSTTCKLSDVRTGDLLLFNTMYSFNTDVLKIVLQTQYVHAGVAFRDRIGQLWVFEVYPDGNGCQVNLMRKRILDGNELCYVRHINKPIDRRVMEKTVLKLLGKRYSYNFVPLVLNAWLRKFMVTPMLKHMGRYHERLCSELVADVYSMLGVMDFENSTVPAGMMQPSDYCDGAPHPLPFMNEYKFGKEQLIT